MIKRAAAAKAAQQLRREQQEEMDRLEQEAWEEMMRVNLAAEEKQRAKETERLRKLKEKSKQEVRCTHSKLLHLFWRWGNAEKLVDEHVSSLSHVTPHHRARATLPLCSTCSERQLLMVRWKTYSLFWPLITLM